MPFNPVLQNECMYVRVLGCASAKPTLRFAPTCQTIHLRGKTFMVDCGEGAQRQMIKYGVSYANLHRIFLSHLHGDHCLGLPGLLSTMSLHGFTHPVHIYGPVGTAKLVRMIVELFCTDDTDRIIVHEVSHTSSELIYEDKSVQINTVPLHHRVPTVGYIFRERALLPHLDRASADFHGVPVSYFNRIKQGEDFVKPDGTVVPHKDLTHPAREPYSYAFCSDTAYAPSIVPYIEGVDLLYHETTFAQDMQERAKQTYHSTTLQAAQIAVLAKVKHLLIGHYSARYMTHDAVKMLQAECQLVFPNTLAASDGLLVDFSELRC